jgi:hypothetical protein
VKKNNLYYLSSQPFGEMVFAFLQKYFTEFDWQMLPPNTNVQSAIIVADSNAFIHHSIQIENSKVIVVNPIWQKQSPEPIWLSIPILRNSFLKRMIRFRSSSVVDSFLHPFSDHPYRVQLLEKLKDMTAWQNLFKKPLTAIHLPTNNDLYLMSNTEDPLREVEEQNQKRTYVKTWYQNDLPHSLLAFNEQQRSHLKQILTEITQDKGL